MINIALSWALLLYFYESSASVVSASAVSASAVSSSAVGASAVGASAVGASAVGASAVSASAVNLIFHITLKYKVKETFSKLKTEFYIYQLN